MSASSISERGTDLGANLDIIALMVVAAFTEETVMDDIVDV